MIKGVNKKIIEIKNPDSIYFERAVFYFRPNVRELPEEVAEDEAARYISMLLPQKQKKSKIKSRIFGLSLITVAAGVIVAVLFL